MFFFPLCISPFRRVLVQSQDSQSEASQTQDTEQNLSLLFFTPLVAPSLTFDMFNTSCTPNQFLLALPPFHFGGDRWQWWLATSVHSEDVKGIKWERSRTDGTCFERLFPVPFYRLGPATASKPTTKKKPEDTPLTALYKYMKLMTALAQWGKSTALVFCFMQK